MDLLTDPWLEAMRESRHASFIVRAKNVEASRPISNDGRLAEWAAKFYGAGLHRNPITNSEPALPARDKA